MLHTFRLWSEMTWPVTQILNGLQFKAEHSGMLLVGAAGTSSQLCLLFLSFQECSGLGEMPGSFVPTVTAISTSQDLQWLVQPTLISSMAQAQQGQGQQMLQQQQQPVPTVDPYDLPGTSYATPGMSGYAGGPSAAAVAAGPQRSTRARPRRLREETVSKDDCRGFLLLGNR